MAGTPTPHTVAVCGAGTPLGQRVVQLLAADPGVLPRVVRPSGGGREAGAGPGGEGELAGAAALVLVGGDGGEGGEELDGSGPAELDVAALGRLLDEAGAAGVPTVVVVSSALAYGAWANNPVPLTEEAPLRPPPGFAPAAQRAELERRAAAWRAEHPDATVAVLRPTVVVDRRRPASFERSPWSGRRAPVRRGDPPRQLLDLDDLASAVDLAWRQRLDGPFNVAPDGWIAADELRELVGPALALPPVVEGALSRWWPRRHPEVEPYLRQPWVVANDRLRAAGWAPVTANEEALVEAQRPRGWRALSPRHRQELSLGVVAGAAVLAAGGVALAVRRRLRRRAG